MKAEEEGEGEEKNSSTTQGPGKRRTGGVDVGILLSRGIVA